MLARTQATYGYTAKQLVSKIEKDPGAVSILEHLLRKTSEAEQSRLLLRVLPQRYRQIRSDAFPGEDVWAVTNALSAAFRSAFEVVSTETKTEAMKRYVTILKEESGELVREYEDAFVRAADFAYLEPDDLALVKKHLLSRLSEGPDTDVLKIVDGIGPYLTDAELSDFVTPLIRVTASRGSGELRASARGVLEHAVRQTTPQQDQAIAKIFDIWISFLDRKGLPEGAARVRELRAAVCYDPFAEE